jgi:4-amino-4-deoxy-L-arabinose transferase-like glycosyltransferase
MIPLALFGVALIVRAIVGSLFSGPAYPDSYYYVHVAEQLAAGHGFSVDYIWNFDDAGGRLLGPAPMLPVPANALWMPLAEIIQVPFVWLLGAGPLASGLPFWIVGALASPIAYMIGLDAGLGRTSSLAAGLLVAVPAGLTPFVAQPDNFALLMTLGALSLWLCARAIRGDRRAFVLGGLVVALATLARADGALLGVPFAVVGLSALVRGRPKLGMAAAAGCGLLFVITMAPWLLRQMEVFGSLLPTASSGRMLWLTDYQQLFSESNPPTPDSFFGQGSAALLWSRAQGLLAAVSLFVLIPLGVVLAPVAAIGAWQRRRDLAFAPALAYAALLFATTALLFPVLVTHGTFLHSAAALVPHSFLLASVGVAASVRWVAARRPAWNGEQAARVFSYGAVAVALLVGAVQTASTVGEWSAVRAVHVQLAQSLSVAPSSERVMSASPGALRYLSGHPGLVTPADPLPVIAEVIGAYDVRWLVLERSSVVPALAAVLSGEVDPAWLSPPLTSIADAHGEPVATLYAVCTTPGDSRCAALGTP